MEGGDTTTDELHTAGGDRTLNGMESEHHIALKRVALHTPPVA